MIRQAESKFIVIVVVLSLFMACSGPQTNNEKSIQPDVKDTLSQAKQEDVVTITERIIDDAIEKSNNPFTTLDYNKVIAYDYYCEGKGCDIVKDRKLVTTIRQKRTLTNKQAQNVLTILSDSVSFGGWEGDCFNPHLGIVFYNDKEIVSHFSICLECNNLHASTPFTFMDNIYQQGFSKSGKKGLNSLCRQLKFSHCRD